MPKSINQEVTTRVFVFLCLLLFIAAPNLLHAAPENDMRQLQRYFLEKAPAIPLESYADDYYRIEENISRSGPIYSQAAEQGRNLFNKEFDNGHSYAFCFRSNGIGIATDYPYFDVLAGEVKTLAMEINACREENGELPYAYDSEPMKQLLLYMFSTSKQNIINTIMPNDEPAEAAFLEGKRLFFARQGQLDMACAHCHIDYADKRYADKQIPPALGLPLRMPRYVSGDGAIITLHEQINECLSYTRAKPYPLQSETLRNLEFYLYYVNNTLPLKAPGVK